MNEQTMEALVAEVTRQVLSAMGQAEPPAQQVGKPHMLVLAKEGTTLPTAFTQDGVVHTLAEYEACQNILCYQRVIVGDLSITQLSDIAHARMGDGVSCAVLYALLSGVDVVLLESALAHRRFAGKGSTALYRQLEDHVSTLEVFGVKLVSPREQVELPPVKPAKFVAPSVEPPVSTAKPSVGRLITERDAMALVARGQGVELPPNAVLTPSAKDVFAQHGVPWA